jgi:amidophosphoribosyltransferase
MKSETGIGHVRYATCGCDDKEYAQPFEHFHGKKNRWFSLAFNGNIANYPELVKEMEKDNYHFARKTDTEILILLLAKFIKKQNTLTESFTKLSKYLDGAYNIAFIDAERTLACCRDPLGIRPLCYAEENGKFAFASESVALQSIGFTNIKDLEPGKILIHKEGKTKIETFAESKKKAHCFFEWVYFAHAASRIDGKVVYNVRYNLGKELAKIEKESTDENTIVVAVPDSSTPCGNGFAQELGIKNMEGLIRNRYVGRTFIESKDRAERVQSKFTVIKEVFDGKKVFLLEDSIVRGTTLKNLISLIKKYGNPKEIHVRVSCPPIRFPCFYGIDMSTKKELVASDKNEKEIAQLIGADSVKYQTIEGLIKAIGLSENELCLACLNGNYPTPAGKERANN